ncbi:hypothetical protein MP228_012507 [Amoeboaphelidium protococcarum]|nr:hypothetical protein MP228_012507 [Amoeboaphelidium protococcarum]
MKYFSTDIVDALNAKMTEMEGSNCLINGRMEVYVGKRPDKSEKQLIKKLAHLHDVHAQQQQQQQLQQQQSNTINRGAQSDLDDIEYYRENKNLIQLIEILNFAYPDYDFSYSGVDLNNAFVECTGKLDDIMQNIAQCLGAVADQQLSSKIFHALNLVVGPYALYPLPESEPQNPAPSQPSSVSSTSTASKRTKGAVQQQKSSTVSSKEIQTQSGRSRKSSILKKHQDVAYEYQKAPDSEFIERWNNEVEIYQYLPVDENSDPLNEDGNSLWTFHYIFRNIKLMRHVYLCLCAYIDSGSSKSSVCTADTASLSGDIDLLQHSFIKNQVQNVVKMGTLQSASPQPIVIQSGTSSPSPVQLPITDSASVTTDQHPVKKLRVQ